MFQVSISMAKRPCLVFSSYALRPTDGGPSGFLGQNLSGKSSSYFDFKGEKIWMPWSWKRSVKNALRGEPLRTMKQMGFTSDTPLADELIEARTAFVAQGGPTYSWVWFHDVMRLAGCADLFRPGQRFILQSHSPELPGDELANMGGNAEDVAWIRDAERFAFERADVLVFPNSGALSIYETLVPAGKRVAFVASGSAVMRPRSIAPLDPQFVYYLYIGRRVPVKGFDLVIDAFSRAHAVDPSVRLILLGDGAPVDAPGVIDVGRSNEPAVWIAACDYLVSANRQSYFDLSVMEALSIGTPLIMACTGGHGYFGTLDLPGIYCLPAVTPDLLAEALLKNRRKRLMNESAQMANRDLYRAEFATERYLARVNEFLQRLSDS